MGCLDDVLSLDGTLDKRGRQKRTLFLLIDIACIVLLVIGAAEAWMVPRGRHFYVISSSLATLTSLAAVLCVLCKVKLTTTIIVFCGYIHGFTTLFSDLTARAAGNTTWPVLVVIIDFLLVMEIPTRYSMWLVCVLRCHGD